jgi:hypothetical protein
MPDDLVCRDKKMAVCYKPALNPGAKIGINWKILTVNNLI